MAGDQLTTLIQGGGMGQPPPQPAGARMTTREREGGKHKPSIRSIYTNKYIYTYRALLWPPLHIDISTVSNVHFMASICIVFFCFNKRI